MKGEGEGGWGLLALLFGSSLTHTTLLLQQVMKQEQLKKEINN